MNEVSISKNAESYSVNLSGRIDSNNSPNVEKEIFDKIEDSFQGPVIVDAEKLEYISSAGLRVLLHLRKQHSDLKIINVSSEVYEILDMTGFNQMMTVEKAYKVVSIEGCEVVGRGANGTVYRIDEDNVVKAYNNADALADIQHEREVARLALVLGIPTAISYDVVKVGDSYGSVFELLNSKSFSKILAGQPEKYDWCVDEFVKMLKTIHGTKVPEGKLPKIKDTVIGWCEFDKEYIPENYYEKLRKLVDEVPDTNTMIHGDYHTNNVVLQGDEVILIDMDTLAVGHPIFELASMFNSFEGYGEYNGEVVSSFLRFPEELSYKFLNDVFARYLGMDDMEKVLEIKDKAKIVGYARMMRRSIRRGGLDTEEKRAEIELWKKHMFELLDKTDTLLY